MGDERVIFAVKDQWERDEWQNTAPADVSLSLSAGLCGYPISTAGKRVSCNPAGRGNAAIDGGDQLLLLRSSACRPGSVWDADSPAYPGDP